jgi:ATP-dependent helicase/nuclease subunit B
MPRKASSPSIMVSPSAEQRVGHACAFLRDRGVADPVLVLAASQHAASELCRSAHPGAGATFGWRKATLRTLAFELALPGLARQGKTPAAPLLLEALMAQVVLSLGDKLGRYAAVADRPGLPRALLSSVSELRLAGLRDVPEDEGLGEVMRAFEAALATAGLADLSMVLHEATLGVSAAPPTKALVLLDVPLSHAFEASFVAALAGACANSCFTLPAGEARAVTLLQEAIQGCVTTARVPEGDDNLRRLQRELFAANEHGGPTKESPDDETFALFSAPGESREAVEIARAVTARVRAGVPYDQIAVALRSPAVYGPHIHEAFARADIPGHFAKGTTAPDPGGRALVALLACAAEDLSAKRFAEYVSLGEVKRPAEKGIVSSSAPNLETLIVADDDLRSPIAGDADEPASQEPTDDDAGTRLHHRAWERLIHEAAVIGSLARWDRRLSALGAKIDLDLADMSEPDGPRRAALVRKREALAELRAYAMPLLSDLNRLRALSAPLSTWATELAALANRALARPARVTSILAELAPLTDGTPVGVTFVRRTLEARLVSLTTKETSNPYGKVFVGPIDELRGLRFDTVFVPGIAERMFPQKLTQDPILSEDVRATLGHHIATRQNRAEAERALLRLAVGAATAKVFVSYPRLDVEQARPRTPSFYGLELVRAARGRVLGFEEFAASAGRDETRLGWPAPNDKALAIDNAEHDLALLEQVLSKPESESIGMARYLLTANDHLARALRFRAKRWLKSFSAADGLVDPYPAARAAMAAHGLTARSFSPTALQNYAACPYRFFLYAVHKLAPREEPEAIEELDALSKGSLVHETQFTFFVRMRDRGALPVTEANLEAARKELDATLDELAARYKEDLYPTIERVWDDGIGQIRADLREWLRLTAKDTNWAPTFFELSFGLEHQGERDPLSVDAPLNLSNGIQLRGSIDLVETGPGGVLRATDYKTGKQRASKTTVIGGGETLQPVLYALAIEAMFPGKKVTSGRLFYCTSVGLFESFEVRLDDTARAAAKAVADAVGQALEQSFLPAAPASKGCQYCDYRTVCGPYEEQRIKRKAKAKLLPLVALRETP